MNLILHYPKFLVISCCDSRVDPAHIMNTAPGELFIVRNIANLVPVSNSDENLNCTNAAIEFAVKHLHELNGKSISESKIRENYGLLIVGITSGTSEAVLNPGSDYILSIEDKLMLIGSQENLNDFKENIKN